MPKAVRDGSTTEYLTWLKLSYKEKLLRSVIADANKSLAQVMESIRYARHVQHNQLPDSEQVGQRFASFDVRWQPRDTIGGDMWWASVPNSNGTFALAVTDSTGHGVPGAMLSLLVNNSLERIYGGKPEIDPASALLELDALVRAGLNQQAAEGDSDDGCDAILLSIDRARRRIRMAAARLDLFQISAQGEVQLHRGARVSLGYRQPIATARIPSTQEIIGAEGDLFLMVTDGFTDQPGGPGERALGLGHRRLGAWAAELAGMSASQALVLLQQRLHEWQGKQVRRDDVTMLAFTL